MLNKKCFDSSVSRLDPPHNELIVVAPTDEPTLKSRQRLPVDSMLCFQECTHRVDFVLIFQLPTSQSQPSTSERHNELRQANGTKHPIPLLTGLAF